MIKKRSHQGNTGDGRNGGYPGGNEDSTRSNTSKTKKPTNPLSLDNTLKRKQDNDTILWLNNKITWKEYDQQMITMYTRAQFYDDDIIDRTIELTVEYKDTDLLT